MKLFSKSLTALLITITLSYSFAQKKQSLNLQIDSLIQLKNPTIFNGVILITKNGKTKYSKAYGFRNVNSKTPLKLNDQFEIMSSTKQITAVLILQEVEKGNIDLQSPIKKYLPSLSQTWADSVTVHQLLNHTHGIIDLEKPLAFKPGTDYKYGNLSNNLLGKIIENVTQKSYREVAESLFKSLKMNETFCYSKSKKMNLVTGHMSNENILKTVENSMITEENIPADGVVTTANDLQIWNSKLHGGKILQPETYKLMTSTKVLSQHNVFGAEKMGYGYGIRNAENFGIKFIGHTGLGDGFSSLNIYIPKSKVSVIVLENVMNENPDLYYYFETKIKDLVLKSDLVK